jgi:glutathione S-transferase
MTGIPYELADFAFQEAPKGKAPYITTEEGKQIGDSTFILEYLKQRYGKDPDAQLSAAERAVSLAFRRMLKENDYWVIMHSRYKDPTNWPTYRKSILEVLPASWPEEQKAAIPEMMQNNMIGQMQGHGIGRHTQEEVYRLGVEDFTAVADYLGDKPYLMGSEPTTVDATAYGFLINVIDVPILSPVRDYCRSRPNLIAYCRRMGARYFPEFAPPVGSS